MNNTNNNNMLFQVVLTNIDTLRDFNQFLKMFHVFLDLKDNIKVLFGLF